MTEHRSACSPDCRYRSMYEGSQASLADMAAKQASGVKRIDALRSGLLDTLKRNYPGMYVEHEKRLGKPLTTLSDEALLAYLSAFLNQPPPSSAVRTAISAATVASAEAAKMDSAGATGGSAPTEGSGQTPSALDRIRSAAARGGIELLGSDADVETELIKALRERKQVRDSEDEDWAFLSEYVPPQPSEEEEIDWNVLFEDEPPADTADETDRHAEAPSAPSVEQPRSSEDALNDHEPEVDDLFDDGKSHDWGSIAEMGPDAATGPNQRNSTADSQAEAGRPQQPQPEDAVSDTNPRPGQDQTQPFHNADTLRLDPDEVAGEGRANQPETEPTRPKQASTESQLHLPGAVRPEIVQQPPRPKSRRSAASGRKALRVSAVKDNEEKASSGETASGSVPPDGAQAIVSRMLAGPVPVFGADISAALGSTDAYHEWEDQSRALGQKSPVRFITPKPRHRQRGLLVLPLENGPSEGPWRDCLDSSQLRGARLYELAVVLHQVGTGARSVDISEETVTVRAALATGMTGLILCTSNASGQEIAKQVQELLRERLSGIIILTTSSDSTAVEDISDSVREALKSEDVKVTTPVVAARSWSWAQNPTGTVVSVAG